MEGCGGDFFCPDQPVTREDMAVWIERGLQGATYTPPAATGVFEDVDPSYCLAGWIELFYDDGYTAGCSADTLLYCPYAPMDRATMAVFLVKVKHGPGFTPPPCQGIFNDVPCPDHWAADHIEQLKNDGVSAGCSADPPLFCPDKTVSRAQMAVFLVKSFGLQ